VLPDFRRGRDEAEADIASGILGERVFGKLVPWWEDVARLLQDRYQIRLEGIASCLVRQEDAAAAQGYNERMSEAITARYGCDVVAATWREVERKRKKRRGKL